MKSQHFSSSVDVKFLKRLNFFSAAEFQQKREEVYGRQSVVWPNGFLFFLPECETKKHETLDGRSVLVFFRFELNVAI